MNTREHALCSSREHRYFTWSAAAIGLIVFGGFARTFYLKVLFDVRTLPLLVHIHATLMTAWFVLLFVQTRLIAGHRVNLHKQLGLLGAALAMVMVGVLLVVSVYSVRLGHTPGPPPLALLCIDFGETLLFAVFVCAGLLRRRRGDYHKRLILLASLILLAPAIVRIPLYAIQAGGPLSVFGLTDALVLICVAIDTICRRRLHPAFGWGLLIILAYFPVLLWLAQTPQWLRLAQWLIA